MDPGQEVIEDLGQSENNAMELSEFKLDDIFRLSQSEDFSPYKISDPIKAQVLMINIQEYQNEPEKYREGSDKDVYSLIVAFKKLGIPEANTRIESPLVSKEKLKTLIQTMAQRESNKDLDVFITVILAHGKTKNGKEVFLASCGEEVELHEDIISPFTGPEAHLAGKPKLFFVQACRGNKRDKGLTLMTDSGDSPSGMPAKVTIPVFTDILIAQPSAPDHVSLRHKKQGSLFIQHLANRLYYDAADYNEDLNTIMTRVAMDVSHALVTDGRKQAVWWTSSLRKKFYFKQQASTP